MREAEDNEGEINILAVVGASEKPSSSNNKCKPRDGKPSPTLISCIRTEWHR